MMDRCPRENLTLEQRAARLLEDDALLRSDDGKPKPLKPVYGRQVLGQALELVMQSHSDEDEEERCSCDWCAYFRDVIACRL